MLSGIIVPLSSLPQVVADVVQWLPSGAMAQAVHRVLGLGQQPSLTQWVALVLWAVAAPLLAARTFTFD